MTPSGLDVKLRERESGRMTSPVYVSDKMVVNVVPYAARRAVLRLDVGPFALLYFAVYFCIWQWDTKEGTGKIVALMVLPIVLVCHLLVFLCTQWSVRFNCLVSQRRVASIDGAEVRDAATTV